MGAQVLFSLGLTALFSTVTGAIFSKLLLYLSDTALLLLAKKRGEVFFFYRLNYFISELLNVILDSSSRVSLTFIVKTFMESRKL